MGYVGRILPDLYDKAPVSSLRRQAAAWLLLFRKRHAAAGTIFWLKFLKILTKIWSFFVENLKIFCGKFEIILTKIRDFFGEKLKRIL